MSQLYLNTIVVMIVVSHPLQVKCHQYWPETGSLGLGDITVSVIDTQELAYYTIRTFRVIMVKLWLHCCC